MGAKTKAKIKAIQNDMAVWRHLLDQTVELRKMQAQELTAKDKAKEACDAYYEKQGWGGQKATREAEMDTDPQWKKLSKTYEDKLGLLTRIQDTWDRTFQEAKKTKAGIITQVKELDAYVAKKEKDKKFFWQKKSVTEAKKFIKEMKEWFEI